MAFRTNKTPVLQEKSASGAVATFNTALAMPLASCNIAVNAWQEGSGTPSPDNVRPISGWSAIHIGSDAKYAGFINFNQLIQNGNFAVNSNWSLYNSDYAQMSIGNNVLTLTITQQAVAGDYLYGVQQGSVIGDSSHKYLFSGAVKGSRSCKFTAELGGSRISTIDLIANTKCDISFISTPATYNKRLLLYPLVGVEVNDTFEISNIMLIDLTVMFGTTKADEIYQMEQQTAGSGVAYVRSLFPNDYYDYNAGTLTTVSAVNGSTNSFFTINIGSTVYGGEYDARTGLFTVTHGFETYDGSADETWDAFNIDLRMGVRGRTTANKSYVDSNISNIFVNNTSNETYADEANLYTWRSSPYVSNLVFFYVPLSENITSVEQWRTWLSNHPTTICYELATPQTIQLPPCPIDALEGVNNIFADTGDVDLTYKDLDIAKRGSFREVFKLPS